MKSRGRLLRQQVSAVHTRWSSRIVAVVDPAHKPGIAAEPSHDAHPVRAGRVLGRFRLSVLCDNLDEHDEEHLGLGLQLCVELLEEQEDDAGAAERQRELGAIRERLDEEGA